MFPKTRSYSAKFAATAVQDGEPPIALLPPRVGP